MRGRDKLSALISFALTSSALLLPGPGGALAFSLAPKPAKPVAASAAPSPASAASASGADGVASAAGAASQSFAGASAVAPSAAADPLLTQAEFLLKQHRADLARPVLYKLVAGQPVDPRALLMLGDLDVRENRMDEARRVLDTLELHYPDKPETRDMQSLWRLYTVDRERLDLLRQLHRAGREPEAAQLARELFLAGLPPASMREEFGDVYGRGSRVTSSNGKTSSGRATTSTRRGGSSRPWVETDPVVLDRQRGYDALSVRDEARAEAAFHEALKRRPRDASSLAGMGILRLRQGRFSASDKFFDQALALQKGNTSDWRDMQRTARYWDLVEQARAAMQAGRLDTAQRLLESAHALLPADTEAPLLLAELHRQRGEFDRANALYDEVLARDPGDRRALRDSLAMALSEVRTPADIDSVLNRASEQARKLKILFGDLLDAGQLRDAADGLMRRNQPAAAARVLERGVAALPTDAWLRYDLARIYQQRGDGAQASALMEEGMAQLARQPQPVDDLEMRQAAALIALGNDQDAQALHILEPIDPASSTDALRSLRERALFEGALRRYRAALTQGDAAAMKAALQEAEQLAGATTDRRLRVAAARLEAGQGAAATAMLDGMDPSSMARDDALRWAQLAMDAGRENEAAEVISRLGATTMSATASSPTRDDVAFRDSLIDTQARLAERRIDRAIAEGNVDDARRLADESLKPWTTLQPVPAAAQRRQAELWIAAGQATQALPWLAEQLRAQPTDITLRLLRIQALDASDQRDEARAEMRALVEANPTDADVRLEAARLAREDGDYNAAMAHLRAVAPGQAAQSTSLTTALDGTSTPAGSGAVGPAATASPPPVRSDVQSAIDRIEARRQAKVEFGLYTADRSARAGVDAMHLREASAVITWPVGYNGHVFGQIDQVNVSAGTLPTSFSSVEDFGKIQALGGGADLPQALKQSAHGQNVAVGWTDDRKRVDIGVTGLGMPVQNVVGGWLQRFSGQGNDYWVDVSRRPLTSSLITYAGTHDPITGEVWGGVTTTGATFHLGRDLPRGWSLGSSLRVASLSGKNVERNTAITWRTTIDKDWIRSEPLTLNAGLAANIWHYAHNSNYASFGHGNYYSPQRYVSLGIPVQISGRVNAWSYLLRGSLARSWTQEDGAPYYPTNAALQAVGNPTFSGGGHGGGFGFSLRGMLEYEVSPRWVIGGGFDIDRSTSYSPNRAMIYLRHFFQKQSPALSVPPSGVTPYSQY